MDDALERAKQIAGGYRPSSGYEGEDEVEHRLDIAEIIADN